MDDDGLGLLVMCRLRCCVCRLNRRVTPRAFSDAENNQGTCIMMASLLRTARARDGRGSAGSVAGMPFPSQRNAGGDGRVVRVCGMPR